MNSLPMQDHCSYTAKIYKHCTINYAHLHFLHIFRTSVQGSIQTCSEFCSEARSVLQTKVIVRTVRHKTVLVTCSLEFQDTERITFTRLLPKAIAHGLFLHIFYSALYPRQQPWLKSDNSLLCGLIIHSCASPLLGPIR